MIVLFEWSDGGGVLLLTVYVCALPITWLHICRVVSQCVHLLYTPRVHVGGGEAFPTRYPITVNIWDPSCRKCGQAAPRHVQDRRPVCLVSKNVRRQYIRCSQRECGNIKGDWLFSLSREWN